MVSNTFKIIGARFSKSDAELLKQVCDARGEDVSDFVRRSVRKELAELSFFTDMEKKALGVKRVDRKKTARERGRSGR